MKTTNQQLMNEIETNLSILNDKIIEGMEEFNNYLEIFGEEKFEEIPNETEDDAIKRAKIQIDKLDELINRNELSNKNALETIEILNKMTELFNGIVISTEVEKEKIAIRHNELIDIVTDLEQIKTKKLIDQYPIQRGTFKNFLGDFKNEWDGKKIETKETLKKQILPISNPLFNYLDIYEIKELEKWTGMQIGNIIFDSDVDDWNQETSVFDQKVLNKSNLIFLIEDDDGNKFGGYINSKINEIESYITGFKSFVFSLKSNGRLNGMFKFDVIQSRNAFGLCNKSEKYLFAIGDGDINIAKERNNGDSFCQQKSFNYSGIQNVLCGTKFFIPKRITVIQFVAKEEIKIKEVEKSIYAENEIKQIEKWTGMQIGNIIFDSDVDDWNVNTSVFDQRVLNKRNLIFLIEDDDGNLFGGYINAKIDKYEAWINDPKAFVFSLKSNGRLNGMMRFDINQPQYAILILSQTNTWLFSIGNGGFDGSQDDINVMKKYCEGIDQFSGCKQSSYNYNGIENSLCGKQTFVSKRIKVIQLI